MDQLELQMDAPPRPLVANTRDIGTYRERRADAEQARDLGMARVATDPSWAEYAFDFLAGYCRTHPTMFPDDLWAEGLTPPREARAFGPVIQRAARCGMIVKTAETRARLRGHMTLAVVWRSTIYEDA
jgi:hypothetical protein